MTYEFGNLSPADFEDLVRDLIGREFGVRFEAFAAGPDRGMDGRHAKGSSATILQAKHYARSSYASLKSQMKREHASITELAPARYVLATSCPLTPPNKSELAGLIAPSLLSEADILGPGDLNALLRKYPEIVKSHIKLWLSDAAVLDRVVHSAAHLITDIQMPAMSGADLQDRLIADGHHTPIIFVTAFPDEGIRARVLKAGAYVAMLARSSADASGPRLPSVYDLQGTLEAKVIAEWDKSSPYRRKLRWTDGEDYFARLEKIQLVVHHSDFDSLAVTG